MELDPIFSNLLLRSGINQVNESKLAECCAVYGQLDFGSEKGFIYE